MLTLGMMFLQPRYKSLLAAMQEAEYITELGWPLDLQHYYDTVLLQVDKVEVTCKLSAIDVVLIPRPGFCDTDTALPLLCLCGSGLVQLYNKSHSAQKTLADCCAPKLCAECKSHHNRN